MAQQRRIIKNNISKREQQRIDAKKAKERESFSKIAMKVFIIIILVAIIMGLAIQIIAYS